jgi:hypothetical protein
LRAVCSFRDSFFVNGTLQELEPGLLAGFF